MLHRKNFYSPVKLGTAALLPLLAAYISACGNDGSTTSGEFLWSDFYSGPTPLASTAVAEDVATCDGRYFVVGETHTQMLLRAYAVDSGEVEWQTIEPFEGNGLAEAVVCEAGRVYVSGRSYWERNAAFLRAYDGKTGSKLWEHVFDEGEWTEDVDLAARDGKVFFLSKSNDPTVLDLFGLEGETGDVLWKSSDTDARIPSLSARISVWNEQVCTLRDSGRGDLLHCYDRGNGELLWVAPYVGAPGRPVASRIDTGKYLVAFGQGEGLSGVVAAYDPRNGALLWAREDYNVVNDVHVLDERVLVTGIDFTFEGEEEASEVSNFRVEVLDKSGATVWVDRHVGEGVRQSVVVGDRLFVAGEEWHSRVYNVQSGQLLALQDGTTPPGNRWAWAIAAEHDHYAIVGATFRSDGRSLDFAVRAYGITTQEP